MKELDISKNDDILVYSDFGIIGASRAYWMFKAFNKNVFVLNDTIENWKRYGNQVD